MTLSRYTLLVLLTVLITLLSSCDNDKYSIPKPRMYPKIDFPDPGYQIFDKSYCSMSFEFPQSTTIEKKENFFEELPADECWFNIHSKALNYDIHCSYFPLQGKKQDVSKLIDDSFKMANKHNQKANYREEYLINNKYGVTGIQFEIEGPVASPVQYYLTDSTHHFFRASLYFNAVVNPDSIAPVLEYVKKDIKHMVETFEWTQ